MALGTLDLEVPETHQIVLDGTLEKGVYAKDIILSIICRYGINGLTDKAVVISGNVIENMTNEEKMTIANMTIEMGAMIGYIAQDDEEIGKVSTVDNIDVKDIKPVVSCPHSPDNVVEIKKLPEIKIDQVVIGSCTNGRKSDFEIVEMYWMEEKFQIM